MAPGIGDVRTYLAGEQGLAVVSTTQADGRVLSSVANCGVTDHPFTGAPCVALVSAGGAARLAHIRRSSQVTIMIRRGWNWVAVTHDDFEEYDRVMSEQARAAILVAPDRILGNT